MSPPTWKTINPPCEAHVILSKMFEDNKIPANIAPAAAQKLHPEFQRYSTPVFTNHFKELRDKWGAALRKFSPEHDDGSNCSTGATLSKKMRLSDGGKEEEGGRKETKVYDDHIKTRNASVQMSVFKDPQSLHEMLIIVYHLPSGVENASFDLVGDGPGTRTAKIEYDWPTITIDPEEYFDFDITCGTPRCHPKFLSLRDDLRHFRPNVDSVPKAEIEVTLPISVQTTTASRSVRAVRKRSDGTRLLIVELMAYQAEYVVRNEEKQLKFRDLD